MSKEITYLLVLVGFLGLPSVSSAQESQDAGVQELTAKVAQLEARVKQLEALIAPSKTELEARSRRAVLASRVQERFKRDQLIYDAGQLKEMENIYQVAQSHWNTPEAVESLKKVVARYPRADRTGCALLYLGQMTSGEESERYLQTAISDYDDSFYGDSVQVGAYARFVLAERYRQRHRCDLANLLYDELRTKYPDALDHTGRLLIDLMPK